MPNEDKNDIGAQAGADIADRRRPRRPNPGADVGMMAADSMNLEVARQNIEAAQALAGWDEAVRFPGPPGRGGGTFAGQEAASDALYPASGSEQWLGPTPGQAVLLESPMGRKQVRDGWQMPGPLQADMRALAVALLRGQ